VAIRRATPDLSRDVQNEMRVAQGKVSVSVLASIDSAGTVQSVKVVSSTGEPSPSGPYIRLAALNAARQWKFRPATAGGKPVPSQTTLVFNF
jgi:outer membrane biosynthesis protein TonB